MIQFINLWLETIDIIILIFILHFIYKYTMMVFIKEIITGHPFSQAHTKLSQYDSPSSAW